MIDAHAATVVNIMNYVTYSRNMLCNAGWLMCQFCLGDTLFVA